MTSQKGEDTVQHERRSNSLRQSLKDTFKDEDFWVVVAVIFFFIILLVLPFAVLPWALVKYAQGNVSSLSCEDRLADGVMIGNSDFYGLGIRIGLYLQWILQIVTNAFMSGERRSAAGAGLVFSFALQVALLLAVFQHQCTFTVDVIIILFMYWPGMYIIAIPFGMAGPVVDRYWGINLAARCMLSSMVPPTAWFWIRLATVGEDDFNPTPGGTSIFLFTRISGSSFRAACIFMVAFSFWVFMDWFCTIFAKIFKKKGMRRVAFYVRVVSLPGLLELLGYGIRLLAQPLATKWLERKPSSFRRRANVYHWQTISKNDTKMEAFTFQLSSVLSIGILIWSIYGIEMTLIWNNVRNVYEVNSTSQVIPLIGSVAAAVSLVWNALVKNHLDTIDPETQDMILQAIHATAFQNSSGTWTGFPDDALNYYGVPSDYKLSTRSHLTFREL